MKSDKRGHHSSLSLFLTLLFMNVLIAGCAPKSSPVTATPVPNPGAQCAVGAPSLHFSGSVTPSPTISYTSNQVGLYVDTDSPGSIPAGGTHCNNYSNEICISVTICDLTRAHCRTIPNVLLDTGSYGVRIFNSLLPSGLSPISSGSSVLAECVGFGDGSSEFGPVEYAYVQLGGEPSVVTPIMAIDDGNVYDPPPACTASQSRPDTIPADTGFNGIVGVGLWAQDCGNGSNGYVDCTTDFTNTNYFTCTSNSCGCPATAALKAQVTNPIALLPTDNNGEILDFSGTSLSASGTPSATGTMYLGIGTRGGASSSASTLTAYTADPLYAQFLTQYNAAFSALAPTPIPAFIDSGSSIFFIPNVSAGGGFPDCGTLAASYGDPYASYYSGDFCPSGTPTPETATVIGVNGANTSVSFDISNLYFLWGGPTEPLPYYNYVFNDIGSISAPVEVPYDGSTIYNDDAYFDWGLPFFFGRRIAVGLYTTGPNYTPASATTASGSTSGPFWAF